MVFVDCNAMTLDIKKIRPLTEKDWDVIRNALVYTLASFSQYDGDSEFPQECARLIRMLNGEEN